MNGTKKAFILLVDDNPNNLQVLGSVLADHYKTAIAENGRDALEFVQRQPPDLILLDIVLPDIDGFEVCQRFKAAPETRDIPVIFLTARTETADLVKGFDVGAVDYITKPIQAPEVLARVKTHIHVHTLQQQLAEQNLRLQQEIAEHTCAEEALAEDRNLLQTVIDQVPDYIFVKDRASRFILNNAAHLRALGATTQEEVFSETDFDRFPQELAAQYVADDQGVIQSGTPLINHEERVILPDGAQQWLLTTKVPLRNRQGTIIGLVGINRNITERKQADEQLRKLSRAVEQSASTILITDLAGKIEFANPAFTHITGYTLAEAIAQGPHILQSGRHPREFYQNLWAMLRRGDVWRGEFINKKKNGDLYWEAATISPIKDARGHITHYVAVKEDITERKRMEEALLESQQYARNIIESSLNMIITVDPEYRIVEFNRAAEQTFGYRREEMVGQAFSRLYADPGEAALVQQTVVQERQSFREVSHRRQNGEVFPCLLSASTLYDAHGSVIGYMGISQDITELKRAQTDLLAAHAELQEKNTQLAELNANKDKFFSIIAHDLRSPFNALLGFIELMSKQFDTAPSDKLKEYLAKVRLSAERLYALLENLLTWSRIQRGLVEYTPEPLNLAEIADDIVMLFTSNAEHKQIHLTSAIQKTIPVHADYAMVNTILRNLVSNALKFTPIGGRITLSAHANANHVEVAVADTGRGMSQEVIAQLFRIDSQYTTIGTAGEAGTGLGLHLCHDLVQKNGGSIWVDSAPGQGATFRFTLPLASAADIVTRNVRPVAAMEDAEDTRSTSSSSPVMIIPPSPEQLTVLSDLAEIGDITAIQRQCEDLVRRDSRLQPFAHELHRLAQDFHLKPMRAFLAAYKHDRGTEKTCNEGGAAEGPNPRRSL